MFKAIKLYCNNFFNFKGRSSRADYWWMMLILFIAQWVTIILDSSLVIWLLFNMITAIPTLALSIRRLHDTDRSGWKMLFAFIPLVGHLMLLVCFASIGTPGANQYGYNTDLIGTRRDLQGTMEVYIRNWKKSNPDVIINETELLPTASWIIDYATNNHIEDENVRNIQNIYGELRSKKEW